MLLWGFCAGLASAVFQSVSYVFSRIFINRHRDPAKLTVYSQLWMALIGTLILLAISPWQRVTPTPRLLLMLVGFAVCGNLAYLCFFRAQTEIEASRLSSLLGLKMISLMILNIVVFRDFPSAWQLTAIILASAAAVGMNFSGGRLPWRGCLMLCVTLCCYAVTDTILAMVMNELPGENLPLRAMATAALNFTALGLLSSLWFVRGKFEPAVMKDAFNYGALWITACTGLAASFGLLGVMFGNIVQSSRGFFSVLIGFWLLRRGRDDLEPAVTGRMWVRRGVMAVLMALAMVLYVR